MCSIRVGDPGGGPLPRLATLLAPRGESVVQERVIRTYGSRVMENLLDALHLPFVHPYTIGIAARAPADAGEEVETSYTADEQGGIVRWSGGGATTGPNQGILRQFAPNMMHLVPVGAGLDPDTASNQLVAGVPVDGTRTRSLSIVAPGFSVLRTLAAVIGDRLSWEDNHVVETHDQPEIPRGGEVSVRSDRATLAVRRYHDSSFRDSFAVVPSSAGGALGG